MTTRTILEFVFAKIGAGENPPDEQLVIWADYCAEAHRSLLAAMADDKMREQALATLDEQTAECIRKMSEALDAVDAGELEISPPPWQQ